MKESLNVQKLIFYVLLVSSGLTVAFGYLFYKELTVRKNEAFASEKKCVPYDFEVVESKQTSVTVTWSTLEKCSGYVVWGGAVDEVSKMAVGESSLTKVNSQKVRIEGLALDTEYYVHIVSGEEVYGDTNGRPIPITTEKY